jgi:hypothetical protein
MKALTTDHLSSIQGGGNDTIAGICAGIAVARFGAWALGMAVPGGTAVWLTVGLVCAVNSMV